MDQNRKQAVKKNVMKITRPEMASFVRTESRLFFGAAKRE